MRRSVAALLLLLFCPSAFAETLSGRVVNRTLSRAEAGCPVALIRHGENSADVLRDTSDAEGRFAFQVPGAPEGAQTFLSATYAGVEYHQPVEGASGDPLEIPVYEITGADTAVSIPSHHIVIEAQSGDVTQIVIVRNSGDRTFRTGEGHGHGLELPLPEGVTEITGGPQGLHTHGSILVNPEPVRPGGSQLLFSFRLPGARRLLQTVNYPTGAVDVLVTPADAPVSGAGLQDLGEVAFQGRSFRRLTGSALSRGDRIDIRLGGPAALSDEWLSRDALKWALGGLALAFALLALFFRTGRRASAPAPESGAPDLGARRNALLQQIADLDDRYADGAIPEADYQARREAFKAEVVELTRALEKGEA